jgi:integration host factor subunit beta
MGAANNTITKRDIIERIADESGLKRSDVKAVVQHFLDEIIDGLGEGKRLEFREFGVFEVRVRAARTAQNPKTLEPVEVPAKNTIKFKPGRRMKEAIESQELADRLAELKPNAGTRAAAGSDPNA